MFKNQKKLKSISLAVLTFCAFSGTSRADERELEIHGYGHQGYLQANRNNYLTADNTGSFNYTNFSLVLAAPVSDKTTIWAQVSSLFTDNNSVGVDWVFAEQRVNNDFLWRVGQIRFPMGFYNENKRAKILHLSTLEPLMYQDLKGEEVIPETFKGASAAYNRDVAFGKINIGNINIELFGGQRVSPDPARLYHSTKGGTLTYMAPVDGLRFMGTVFSSEKKDSADIPPIQGTQNGWMVGADYVNNGWNLKAEYGDSKDPDLNIITYYGQAGYTFFDTWTPFARYDYITTNQNFRHDPSFYQKDIVVGVGYRINNNLVLKGEDHILRGYAMPAKRGGTNDTAAGMGATNWNMFIASISFMF